MKKYVFYVYDANGILLINLSNYPEYTNLSAAIDAAHVAAKEEKNAASITVDEIMDDDYDNWKYVYNADWSEALQDFVEIGLTN